MIRNNVGLRIHPSYTEFLPIVLQISLKILRFVCFWDSQYGTHFPPEHLFAITGSDVKTDTRGRDTPRLGCFKHGQNTDKIAGKLKAGLLRGKVWENKKETKELGSSLIP
jgi:hypothetical protein